jgi:hypothetical protein
LNVRILMKQLSSLLALSFSAFVAGCPPSWSADTAGKKPGLVPLVFATPADIYGDA